MKAKTTKPTVKVNNPDNANVVDDRKWYGKAYDAVFNSLFTAIVALVALSGLAVYGLIGLVGDEKICIAVSVAAVILLVGKVANKLKR